MTRIIDWIAVTFASWNHELVIFIISLFPILELRGGLIAAALLQVPYWKALIICMIGNIIPIPFILLLIEKIFKWMKKFKTSGRFVNWLETKTLKKRDRIDRWGFWGLVYPCSKENVKGINNNGFFIFYIYSVFPADYDHSVFYPKR